MSLCWDSSQHHSCQSPPSPPRWRCFRQAYKGFWSTAMLFREWQGANGVLGNISAFLLSNEDFCSGMSLICFTVAENAQGIAADGLIWGPPKFVPVLRVSCKCADRCIRRCSMLSKIERREAEVISICGNNTVGGGGMSRQERALTLLLKWMGAPAHPGHSV